MKSSAVVLLFLSGALAAYLYFYCCETQPPVEPVPPSGATPIKCAQCPALNPMEERYCTQCGELTYEQPLCPSCGVKNFIDDKYCAGCAAELPAISADLALRNSLMKVRDSKRYLEEKRQAHEYRSRVDQTQTMKKEEIQNQRIVQAERDNQIRLEEQQRQQKEWERLQKERKALLDKQTQEEQRKQAEKESWKFKDWEQSPKQEGVSQS